MKQVNERKSVTRIKRVLSQYDAVLAILVLLISLFGLIMIYSASSYRAEYYYHDSTKYFRAQGLFIIGGVIVMVLVSMIDYRFWFKQFKVLLYIPISAFLWFASLIMCIFVVFAGHTVGGSSRWIQLGFINIQPSEVAKAAFVLFGAFVVAKGKRMFNRGSDIKSTLKNCIWIVILALPFIAVVISVYILNLSSAIILAAIIGVMFFCASMDKKAIFILIILLGIGLYFKLNSGGDYRSSRMDLWQNPDKMDQGGQIVQGMLAIGSGGLLGKGLGNSVQKMGNIPEVHTDMIFTIICEELGIVGGIALMLGFMWMLYRIFKIALNATELKGSLIAIGVFMHLSIQFVMNIAVVTNAMPATGVPLPFVSYGGSSLVIMMAEIGLVLNVSKQIYETIDVEDTVLQDSV